MQSVLTPHHRKLIRAAVDVFLPVIVENHMETSSQGVKHKEFIELLETYDDVDIDDITFGLLDQHITFEELKDEPDKIWELNAHYLLVMQLIILRMLPEYDWPIAKNSLYQNLQKRIDILKIDNPN